MITVHTNNVGQVRGSPDNLQVLDHMGGFDCNYRNPVLDKFSNEPMTLWSQYIVNDKIKQQYPLVNFKFDILLPMSTAMQPAVLHQARCRFDKKLENFICSFNGSDHVSRQFLVSALYKFGLFETDYCSKNFIFDKDRLDGNIAQYAGHRERFYRKFFISDTQDADVFYNTLNGFNYEPFDHLHNIDVIAEKITNSFVQIVSETMGTSSYPFTSEKFVYPILCKTLWVGYAQPGYHDYLETYYGFKKYSSVFDYKFDQLENPVSRLIELLSMLIKFSKLSKLDWHDLYLIEQDTIEYNYDWYCSNRYIEKLKSYA
jgi:hypothetical protein